MKLCITSAGKDFSAPIDITFGRAPYFLLIDTETNTLLETVESGAASRGQGAGIAAAQLVADKGVDGVLTGYVGPNASIALREAGIKVFTGVSSEDTVHDALAKFNNGQFNEASTPSAAPPYGPGRGRGLGLGRGMGRGKGRCRRG